MTVFKNVTLHSVDAGGLIVAAGHVADLDPTHPAVAAEVELTHLVAVQAVPDVTAAQTRSKTFKES